MFCFPQGDQELRIELRYKGRNYVANYENFQILGESDNYKLQVSGYSGNAGDNFGSSNTGNNNMLFSTKDRDNDGHDDAVCAVEDYGGWWYDYCSFSNLNGKWGSRSEEKGVYWYDLTGFDNSVAFTEMKIRPRIK